jgi:hypothetical protein
MFSFDDTEVMKQHNTCIVSVVCMVTWPANMQIMGIRLWRNQCKERAEWKRITEKAKTHSVL